MNKRSIPVLLVLMSVALGIYFRSYPSLLPFADVAARQEVLDAEWGAAQKGVRAQYKNLPSSAEQKIAKEIYEERLKVSKSEIESRIASRAGGLRDVYRDDAGHVYLNGIDSYYWLRLLNNLLDKGHIGDREVAGVEYDDLIGNPIDPAHKNNAHLWLGFVFYKTASFFKKDAVLSEVLFYVPIFLSALIAVFSFLVARRLGASDLGGFFASVAVNLSPIFLTRSIGEWFDTDIYNVLFPLLAFAAVLFMFENRSLVRRILLAASAGLFLAFYASTWKGWWFIFDIMVLSWLFFALNEKMVEKEEGRDPRVIRRHLLNLGLFAGLASLFVILLNGFPAWADIVVEPLRLSKVLQIAPSSWPNVYLTVAELGPAKPFEVAQALGGYLVFFGGMLGLIYCALAEHGLRHPRYGFGLVVLVFWVVGTFYAAVAASRFILLLVVPVGLAFGVTVSKLYGLVDKVSQHLKRYRTGMILRYATVSLLSLHLVSVTSQLHRQLLQTMPYVNDSWFGVLDKIEKETPPNAVVNSWWDFGHWFKAIAKRRVLMDGMTQSTPYAYWTASVLLAESEEEAARILKMINASGNQAADLLTDQEGLAPFQAVETIRTALRKTKPEARKYLAAHFPAKTAEDLLAFLFPKDAPPVYFIVSSDMPVKISAISYVGNWDFKKVDLWHKKGLRRPDFVAYGVKTLGLAPEEAEQDYLAVLFQNDKEARGWFSKFLSYRSGLGSSRQDGQLLFFDNGLVVNLEDDHAAVVSEWEAKRGVPQSLFYLENRSLKEVAQKEPSLDFSALLIKKEDHKYESLLLDTPLAKSMLVRLCYLKGEGLRYFKLYHKVEDEKKQAIYVYRMEWPLET